MKQALYVLAIFPFFACAAEATYECRATAEGRRVGHFTLVVDSTGTNVTGTITGSPQPGAQHLEYSVSERSNRLRLVDNSLSVTPKRTAFSLVWTQGEGYTVDFVLTGEEARLTIRELDTVTQETLTCGAE